MSTMKASRTGRSTKKKGGRLAPIDHIRALNASQPPGTSGGKSKTIFQKRDLVEAVRRMSPVKAVLKDQSEGKRERGITTEGPMADGMDSTTKALVDLEDGVNASARRYNELKMTADRKLGELKTLKDALRDLESENTALEAISAKQTPEAVRIEALKAEIAKVNARMEKKDFQKQQLEHMAKRLKTNQVNFDAHIKSMDSALQASKKEYEEVKDLMRQLENSKTQAVQGLHKYQQQLERARRDRERELGERQTEAANAKKMEEWRKEREKVRQEMAAELRGDMSKDQEQALLQQLQEREGQSEQLKAATKERQAKALTLEEAFSQIKQATGVNSLDEMVDKFMGQGANKAALEEEKREAEARLNKYKALKEEAETEFAEMKASGIGGTELSREIYDRMDDEINQAKNALKVNKASCERLESVLVAVRQGAVGLAQRLAPFNDVPGLQDIPALNVDGEYEDSGKAAGAGSEDGTAAAADGRLGRSDVDTMEMLMRCEQRLVRVLEIMASAAGGATARSAARDGEEDIVSGIRSSGGRPETEEHRPWTPFVNTDPVLHRNNVRVASKARHGDMASVPGESGSESEGEHSETEAETGGGSRASVMDRKMVKTMAKSRYQKRMKEKELQERREHTVQNTKSKRTTQREAVSRLTYSREASPSVTFLTQKPDLL